MAILNCNNQFYGEETKADRAVKCIKFYILARLEFRLDLASTTQTVGRSNQSSPLVDLGHFLVL
jgi:hypothetical protein